MNGTGKVSFARKTRRHATGPAVRTGAGGAGNMRAGGPGCGPGGLVLGCLVAWVIREGRRPLLHSHINPGREGGRRRPAPVPSFPDQSRPRRWAAKAGAISFLLPWLHRAAKADDEGRRPFLIRWRLVMLARGCVGDCVRVLMTGAYNIFLKISCILFAYLEYL